MLGLYIHVPFCQKRCFYCSFYSTTCGKRERDAYVQALTEEMRVRAADIRRAPAGVWGRTSDPASDGASGAASDLPVLSTVYFGGGTPSQLDDEELHVVFAAIRRHFRLAPDAEITFECNPDDLAPSQGPHVLPQLLSALGVNRISMGVQSFDDDILRGINRRHTSQQVFSAIRNVHQDGIHNVSVDLIYGLPGQTLDAWKHDVGQAVALSQTCIEGHPAVTHLSSYALSIEPGTHLYYMRAQGQVAEVDDELSLTMYDHLVDALRSAGFEHYEISNFALPGHRSRHNSSYWRQVPYLGLGPGACSYDGATTRFNNRPSLDDYLAAPAEAFDVEHLTGDERYDELVMTRLRTVDGLPLGLLDVSRRRFLLRAARPYIESGHLTLDGAPGDEETSLRLTRSGIFISDAIFADLMSD